MFIYFPSQRRRLYQKLAASAAVLFVVVVTVLAYFAVTGHKDPSRHTAPAATLRVFEPNIPPTATTTYQQSIIFMGDTMLARSIGAGIQKGSDPFLHLADKLTGYGLRVANIETTIADPTVATTPAAKTYTFNAPLSALDILRTSNIDVSVLANNHTGDFGPTATADMMKQFRQKGLSFVGLGSAVAEAFTPLVIDMRLAGSNGTNGLTTIKVGFVAVNDIELAHTKVRDGRPGGAYFDSDLVAAAIREARQQGAAVVVVVPHWGIEYQNQPSSRQIEWGRRFIDAGADAVIGAHPHVVQPTEFYNNKPIVYSLGNFIFDGMEGAANTGQIIELPITLTRTTGLKPKATITVGNPIATKIHIDRNGYPSVLE